VADVNANIGVHIDTSATIAQLKALRAEISRFNQSVIKSSASAAIAQRDLQTNLVNAINATGKFHAKMGLIRTSTESFTHALETNKLSMREYFRYAGGASTTFRKLFTKEFDTISQVAADRVKRMQTQYVKLGRDASGAMKAISITPTTLNMKDYGTQVAMAAQRQALLNQLLKQGSTNLLNFGKNTQWAGRQLMVGFTVPLAYLGTSAAKTFMAIEEQVIKFKRVYGEMFTTSDQTNKALEDVRRLAEEFTKYGVAVEKTIELAAKAAATGKMGADLTAQVAEATRLAVLGGVEQEEALDTTISLTNAFGIAAADLSKKIDFLNAVENQTVVSIEDLTIAVPKAGPVIQQLGGNVEDLAFFLTAMKEGGINASEGANALKSGLASLINPTDKASKMLGELGINIKGIVEANKGNVKGVVLDFAAALDTLDPLNRARAIEQLFGKFQFARLSTLFSNVSKEGTQASRVLDLATASVEELAIISERELKAVEDAIGTNFKEAVQQLRLALEPIGKEFLKVITPIAQTIANLLDKFNNLGDGTKKFIVIATTLVGVIGPTFLMTFGLLANAVANIIKLFTTMRGGFLRLKGGSAVLAEQTNYLTKEQMEATTVAAALDQAHNRLTQRFTSEAVALQKLRAAFDSASAAQARFAATNPGMMIPGFKGAKKFNFGTMKVPGYAKGTDTVPAMLTPGEAVIPADIAQDERFKPIIQALVTGDLPGYQDGTEGVGKQSGRKLKQTVFFDFDDTLARSTSAIEQWKAERGITGKTTPEMYDAFNKDVVAGRKVPIIQENIDKLKRLQAAGVDVRILTARTANETNLESLKKVLASNGVIIQDSKIQLNNTGDTDAKFKASHIKGFLKDNPDSRAQLIDDKIENVKAVRALSSAKDMSKRFGAVVTSAAVEPAEFVKMKDGVLGVKFQGRTYPVGENEAKAKAVVTKLNDELAAQKSQEGRIKTANWATNRFGELVDARDKGRLISTSRIWRKERGRGGINYVVRKALNDLAGGSSYENLIKARQNSEQKLVMQALEDYQKRTGKALTPKQIEQALQIQASHVWPSKDETGRQLKFDDPLKWQRGHVFDDLGILNNYLNRTGTTRTGQPTAFQKVADAFLQDDEFTKQSGLNKQQLYKDLEWARQNKQPTTMQELQSIKRLAELDQIMSNAGVYTNKSVIDRLGIRGVGNLQSLANGIYQAEVSGKLVAARGPEWAKGLAARILDLASMKSVAKGGAPLAEYDFAVARGERIKSTAGSRTVTGATGRKKPASTKAVGPSAGPKDTRLITSKGVKSITPVRVGRFAYGAEGGFGDQRVAGSTTAQEIARERRISLNEAKKLLAQERKLAEARAAGTDVTEESGKATSQKTELDKKQLQQMRYERVSRISSPVAMASGTAVMAGAMMGAPEGFTKMMLGVSVISSILPLMTNPWMLAIAAVVGTGALLLKFNNDIKKAREAGINLAKAMTMSADDVKELSMMTGKPSASEIADRRRKNILGGGITEPQRQFGQNVLESEFGKKLLADVQTLSKTGMQPKDVAKNISTQLGQAVLQGVITMKEAASIASALGEKLGSYEIPLNITGNLNQIFGPNGENLKTDPLRIALEIKKDSINTQAQAFQQAIANRKPTVGLGAAQTIGGATAAGAAIGAGIGAFGGPFAPVTATGGAAIGAVVGAIGGTGAAIINEGDKAKNAKLDAAALQLGIELVAQNQDLVDSLNQQYDVKVKQAKTTAEIDAIEKERKAAVDRLNAENTKTLQLLIEQRKQMGDGTFNAAIKAAADAMYKEGPMAVFKDQALEALNSLESSDFKAQLQLGFASGDIDPLTLTNILNLSAQNKPIQQDIQFLINTEGFADMAVLTQLLNSVAIDPKTGKADPLVFQTILSYINKNEQTFDEDLEAVRRIADFKGAYNVTLDAKTNGIEKLQIATTALKQIEDLPEKVTKQALIDANTNGQFNDIIANWSALSQGKDLINKNLIVNYKVGAIDPNLQNAAKAANQSVPEFLAKGFVAPTPTNIPPTETPGPKKGRDTTLDELLKRLKFIRKASIDAQGGVKELERITAGKGLTKFNGVVQQLAAGPKGGFNREFISFLEGMDNATRKTYMTIKNGQVILTKQGKALKEAFNEKVIGEYQVAQFQAVQDTKAQGAALAKLRAAGIDSATALEMVADANLAVAINSKNISSAELKNMATQAQEAKDKVRELNLELQGTVTTMVGRGQELDETIKVISRIKEINPNVSSEFLQALASDKTAVQGFYDAFFKGAQNNVPNLKDYIDTYFKNNQLEVTLKGILDPQELVRQAQEAFDKASSTIDKYLSAQRAQATLQVAPPTLMNELGRNLQVAQDTLVEAETNLQNIKDATGRTITNYQSEIDALRRELDAGLEIEIRKLTEQIKAEQDKIAAEYDKPIEGLRKNIEKIQRDIEINFTRPIEELNNQIDDIQRGIELNFDRPIATLQEESSDLSNELTLMDKVAESINKKYDEQAAALQKVADINQEISDQQKGQLDLAGALSRGDVAAAAQAAQEMRAQAAARAKERASGVIEAARQAELGGLRSATGMTRAQIEERQFQISQQIFQLEEQKEAQLTKVTELQDQIYAKTQLLEVEQRKIRDLEDQIYAKEVARQAALDALIPKQELLTDLEKKRAAALEKIAEKEDAISKIKNSQAYKDAEKAVADAQKAVDAAQKKLDDIEKKLRDALAKVDAQQAKWDDIKLGIEGAQGAVKDFDAELANAKIAADKLAKAIASVVSADANITGADVFGNGLGTSTVTDEYGLDPKDPDYQEKRRARQGIGMGAGTKTATKETATKALATNLNSAATSATVVQTALGKIAELSKLSAVDQEKIATSIVKQAEQSGLLKSAEEAITQFIKDQVTPSEQIATNTKNMLDSLVAAIVPANTIAGIFNSILSTANAIYQRILSWNTTVTTVHNIIENVTRNITEYITQIIKQVVDTGPGKMYGGKITGYMGGGMVKPMYLAGGGAIGSDTVPAMLTPGEFVVNKASSQAFAPFLTAINESKYPSILAKNISNARPIYQIPIQTSLSQPSYDISSPVFSASPTNIANAAYNDNSSSVYNYSVGISVGGTNASPDTIAKAVMNEIKYLDSQRVKSQKVS